MNVIIEKEIFDPYSWDCFHGIDLLHSDDKCLQGVPDLI